MSKLSRRDFLKSTAAGAVGLAAAGLLGACANETSASDQSECVCEPTTATETVAYPVCEPAENYEPKAAGNGAIAYELDPIDESKVVRTEDIDVLVCGLGPSGFAAALSCAQQGL